MSNTSLLLLVLLVVVLVLVSPIFTIWALNTLFPVLAIPMNVWTWLSVFWIHVVIGGAVSYKKS